jgi:hypothetical protein
MSDDVHPYDHSEIRTIQTMAGHCDVCHRDFSLWEMGRFLSDDETDEDPIETWFECSHCGSRSE